MATAVTSVGEVCRAARRAAAAMAQADSAVKDAALVAIADALEGRLDEILLANGRDMEAGREADIGDALLDRLRLDAGRVVAIAQAVRDIAALGDPVGEVMEGWRLPNGLDVRKVRVPLGVVAVVYDHHRQVFQTHLRWTIFTNAYPDVGAAQLHVRSRNGRYTDLIKSASEERGKCRCERHFSSHREPCGNSHHVLLGDETFCEPVRKFLEELVRVG